jgi:spoIIIJ-associated protein
MSEACNSASDLLNSVFERTGFDLTATAQESSAGCFLDIKGSDTQLLLSQGGEVLDALQHLLNQAFGRALGKEQRIVCDVEGYRAGREAELHAMAMHAAQKVRSTATPFLFGPMDPNERRVIHLSLSTEADLQTESVGEGNARRLKVSLKRVEA